MKQVQEGKLILASSAGLNVRRDFLVRVGKAIQN